MPEIETLDVSYSRKVQLEQFEPVEMYVGLEVSLEDGDDPDEVYDEYNERAQDMVERGIAKRVAVQEMDADEGDGDG
jgi:hypothetical protein